VYVFALVEADAYPKVHLDRTAPSTRSSLLVGVDLSAFHGTIPACRVHVNKVAELEATSPH